MIAIGRAFRWTAGTGGKDIGPGDSTVIVGREWRECRRLGRRRCLRELDLIRHSAGLRQQALWTWDFLPGGNFSLATGVSANGSVVVGQANDGTTLTLHSFRWTAATGMQALPAAPGFDFSYGASGISADGSVIVGTNANKDGVTSADHAYRYTDAGGYQDLGVQPGFTRSVARDVSGDGQTVIGFSQLFPPPSGFGAVLGAYRWTASTGLVPLFFDDETYSIADAVTFDGSRIVGTSTADAGPRAVMWTSTLGSVDLNTYLPTLGVNLTGWNLTEANGISSDGSVISGTGTFNGVEASWIVSNNSVPEPSTLLIAALGGIALIAAPSRARSRR